MKTGARHLAAGEKVLDAALAFGVDQHAAAHVVGRGDDGEGGGFLEQRSGGYGGALQLRLGPVEVKAVGLLTLEPSFALVVVMSIEFFPPIDLTFGFTLNAVGGVIGIEHRLDTDALRAGLSTGALDHILFPADPVAAAPAILRP